MKIKELFENRFLVESLQSGAGVSGMTFYHAGSVFDRFDARFIGRGEGAGILGPGFYFTNNRNVAERYLPFGNGGQAIYTVKLNVTGVLVNTREAPHPRVVEAFNRIAEEIGIDDGFDGLDRVRHVDSMQHGRGRVGSVVKVAGKGRALELFRKYGIQGQYELLPAGMYEVAIFDTSIIQILDREIIEDDW